MILNDYNIQAYTHSRTITKILRIQQLDALDNPVPVFDGCLSRSLLYHIFKKADFRYSTELK